MSSNYKKRSDYFKSIAHDNKLIAHDQPVAPGSDKKRKSFYRVNDLDELNAACSNWAHLPCVVHLGHDKLYKEAGKGIPHRMNSNHLLFLAKLDRTTYPALSDAMESAYDIADNVMSQFLAYMREDLEMNGVCGNLFLFDLNRATAQQTEIYNEVLLGWHLTFYDTQKACELKYKTDNWFIGIEEATDDGCGCGCGDTETTPGGSNNGCSELIAFEDDESVLIEMDDARKQRLGQLPFVQVWFKNDNDNGYHVANVPIHIDAAPPNISLITVENTGNTSGFITLKNTVS